MALDATASNESGVGNATAVLRLEGAGQYTAAISQQGSFLRHNIAVGYRHRYIGGNTPTNNNFNGRNSLMVLNVAAGQTHTLETIIKDTNGTDWNNGNVGKEMILVNPTANPITVACESVNDVIIGGGTSSATKSLPANSAVKVIACCKGTGTTDGFWAWFAA